MTDPNIVACFKERLLLAQDIHSNILKRAFGDITLPESATASQVPGVLAIYDRLVQALAAGPADDDVDDAMLDDAVARSAKEPW